MINITFERWALIKFNKWSINAIYREGIYSHHHVSTWMSGLILT